MLRRLDVGTALLDAQARVVHVRVHGTVCKLLGGELAVEDGREVSRVVRCERGWTELVTVPGGCHRSVGT